jgi:hypothetical protein
VVGALWEHEEAQTGKRGEEKREKRVRRGGRKEEAVKEARNQKRC